MRLLFTLMSANALSVDTRRPSVLWLKPRSNAKTQSSEGTTAFKLTSKPAETYILYRTIRGVGSGDASWPSKARHPVLNLGTFFFSFDFFCLLRPRGVRVPVLQHLVRTPRASRRVADSPKHYLRTATSLSDHHRDQSLSTLNASTMGWPKGGYAV